MLLVLVLVLVPRTQSSLTPQELTGSRAVRAAGVTGCAPDEREAEQSGVTFTLVVGREMPSLSG